MTLTDSIDVIIESEFREVWESKKAKKLDKTIKQKNFRAEALYGKVLPVLLSNNELLDTYNCTEYNLSKEVAHHAFYSTFRFSFLSQIVWEKGGAANYAAHWFTPPFEKADPRFSTCEECLQIFEKVIEEFKLSADNAERCQNLVLTASHKVSCIDYIHRELDGQIHNSKNVYWMLDDFPSRLIKLKLFLTSKSSNPETYDFFKKAYAKIKVKTYLTDRGLTGEYQTNRENRWETHPKSVHFSLYRDCMEIEYTLVKQILEFHNFPVGIVSFLEEKGVVLEGEIEPESRRCPITMEKLFFSDFRDELENLTHGKSKFQVGHINPLKANSLDDYLGHTAQNICWISDVGNEIQKNRSVDETQALIRQISRNYEEAGIFEVNDEDRTDN